MRNKTLIIIGCFLIAIFLIMLLSNKNGFLVAKETPSLNTKNLLAQAARLPIEAQAPALRGISDWINTNPLPEIYLGYLRINNAGNINQDTKPNLPHIFSEPKPSDLSPSRFYFAGTWTIGPEFSELSKRNGKLILRYKAGKVNIVAESDEGKIPVEVFLDGKSKGSIIISSPQLYNLIDTAHDYNWHTLEVRVPDPGFRAFTFTFG